ncbi:MAG: DUF4056 domain-containing protein [Bacteroidetes bacterium]|nr:DUF4056 domain-containing protein [Bacteroidota bacterium]MCB0845790.1 DUF4056 domain-containing protein [Bacteroidota bacterium]MCB0854766.1 DUF4056 domain-containing protein [Bacteroidota bacterium]
MRHQIKEVGLLTCCWLVSILLGWQSLPLQAKEPVLSERQINQPPPRIIRTCCSFGADVKVSGIPGKKITDVSSLEELGMHQYLGDKREGNGIIYTQNGGFIDIGHLRDQADWTAYLYTLIQSYSQGDTLVWKLGKEGGPKILTIYIDSTLTDWDKVQIAGRIAYDLSIWHEIGTWYGTSYIPFVPERYSSFSVEDMYSNLLGVNLGIQAIQSELPYEIAMTHLIDDMLVQLGAVESREETLEAMNAVDGLWWNGQKKLPSRKILITRYFSVYEELSPWLVPGYSEAVNPYLLHIPGLKNTEREIETCYQLEIDLNRKFAFHKLFPTRDSRKITHLDFPYLIQLIEEAV